MVKLLVTGDENDEQEVELLVPGRPWPLRVRATDALALFSGAESCSLGETPGFSLIVQAAQVRGVLVVPTSAVRVSKMMVYVTVSAPPLTPFACAIYDVNGVLVARSQQLIGNGTVGLFNVPFSAPYAQLDAGTPYYFCFWTLDNCQIAGMGALVSAVVPFRRVTENGVVSYASLLNNRTFVSAADCVYLYAGGG